MTVLENLAVATHGLSRSKLDLLRPWRSYTSKVEEAEQLGASFGLGHRLGAYAEELSHGEVRQLEVCLALALKPKVLLLDEPAAGLSPAERVDIRNLLNGLPKELTLVMIEHDMDVLRGAVDDIAVLHLGELVTRGPVAEIQRNELVRELYLGKRRQIDKDAGADRTDTEGKAPLRVITVEDVHTYRGLSYVLQGITLQAEDAQCTALLGRNGMGKTTLVETIMGLLERARR